MKNKIIIVLLTFQIVSCKENNVKEINPNFESFVYANANMRSNNLLKFVGNDSIYLQKKFPEEKEGTYFALIKKADKDYLTNFLNNLDFTKYDSIYTQNDIDGNNEILIVNRNGVKDGIYIHAESGPKELENFSIWLENLKTRQKFVATNKKIDFGNFKGIVTPPPPKVN
jgi:hypothetical protein